MEDLWHAISKLQEKVFDITCTCKDLALNNSDLRAEIAYLHDILQQINRVCKGGDESDTECTDMFKKRFFSSFS